MLAGEPCVMIGIEPAFQGGSIGEVSGAKAACALQLAARDARAGQAISAVLLLETGGVRLQEATLGLNAVAEVLSAILELRGLRPVVGVAAGPLGSFGGMSIAAGLCTRMVLTHEGRLGLNGPEVIESEAGVAEFDSSDRALVWSVDGGAQRYATGLADALVLDDVSAVRARRDHRRGRRGSRAAPIRGARRVGAISSSRDDLTSLEPTDLRAWRPGALLAHRPGDRTGAESGRGCAHGLGARLAAASRCGLVSRGKTWFDALSSTTLDSLYPSVAIADGDLGNELTARLLAVVADPDRAGVDGAHRRERGADHPGLARCTLLGGDGRNPIPVIHADPGSGQGVFEAGSAALNNANVFISKLNVLLDENDKAIQTTMTNVEQFTTMLNAKKKKILAKRLPT